MCSFLCEEYWSQHHSHTSNSSLKSDRASLHWRTIGISSADYAATKFCNQFRAKNLKVLHTVIEPFPLCLSLYLHQQNSHHVSFTAFLSRCFLIHKRATVAL
uniref:Uncharacterized protein n=1 Tax=Ditylum brightwellii TaxID=49249 RepID=A0A6V2GMQ0_9STRA|mmetsp:Transcript_22994/g.30432  ORF Transcript_22994/g.30432 Transcript_22994/m.30432 type:complete len:102 (+) Transcript_22994:118-423(+)